MKRALVILFLAASTAGYTLAQAPANIAGLSMYAAFSYEALSPENATVVDFNSDGTFTQHVNESWPKLREDVITYYTPISGTYTYTQTSATAATLIMTPAPFGFWNSYSLIFDPTKPSGNFLADGVLPTGGSFFSFGVTQGDRALVNTSALITANQGFPTTIGFVIGGTSAREILVRAIGPGLAQFGVSSNAPNPEYFISNSQYGSAQSHPGWSTTAAHAATIAAESDRVGAFSLIQGSNDKAEVYFLSPGAYTITVYPSDRSQVGAELIEVYEVK